MRNDGSDNQKRNEKPAGGKKDGGIAGRDQLGSVHIHDIEHSAVSVTGDATYIEHADRIVIQQRKEAALSLVDVAITKTDTFPKIDLKVRNNSDEVVYLKRAEFTTIKNWDFPTLVAYPHFQEITWTYDVTISTQTGSRTTCPMSQVVKANDVDRFAFKIGTDHKVYPCIGLFLFLLEIRLVFNEDEKSLSLPPILMHIKPPVQLDGDYHGRIEPKQLDELEEQIKQAQKILRIKTAGGEIIWEPKIREGIQSIAEIDIVELALKLASDLLDKKVYHIAIPFCDEVIKREPENAKGYRLRASALLGQDNWDEAINDYEKAIQLDPSLEKEYRIDIMTAHAIRTRKQCKENPDADVDISFREVLQRLHSLEEPRQLEEAVVHREYGVAFYQKGDIGPALDALNRSLFLNSHDGQALFFQVFIYYDLGDIGRASASLRRALEIDPEIEKTDKKAWISDIIPAEKRKEVLTEVHLAAGENLWLKRKYKEAHDHYSAVINLDVNNKQAFYRRYMIRTRVGYFDGALADYERYIDLSGDHFFWKWPRKVMLSILRRRAPQKGKVKVLYPKGTALGGKTVSSSRKTVVKKRRSDV